jgi:hypothetical protein
MKKPFSLKIQVIVLLAICLFTRIPQITNSNMMLDGDECVVALMAKHLLNGQKVPLYFYGQQYGFSFVETVAVSASYLLFGVSDVAVKTAMLVLWISGSMFFFFALRNFEQERTLLPFLLTLLFILTPAWSQWALKARGGYITSFLISSCVLFIVSRKTTKRKYRIAGILGMLLLLVYESQPLWIPGLIPILIFYFLRLKQPGKFVFFLAVFLTGYFCLQEYKKQLFSVWSPKVLSLQTDYLDNIIHLPISIYRNFTGSYFHTLFNKCSLDIRIFAIIMTVLVFVSLLYSTYYILKHREYFSFLFFTLLAVLFSLFSIIFLLEIHYRYLLPLTGFFLLHLYFLLRALRLNLTIQVIAFTLCTLGLFSQLHTLEYNFQNSNRLEMIKMTRYLNRQGIKSTFSTDPLLQWQIIFYSKEKVNSRYIHVADRVPKYAETVNNDLFDPNRRVAVVGYYSQLSEQRSESIKTFGHAYFVFQDPSYESLVNTGFRFE